jgi:hypothetical protein
MIKQRNLGDFLVELTVPGNQSTLTSTVNAAGTIASSIVPFNGRVSAVLARLATAGTTGTQNVDLLKNGTSVTGGAGLFNFASGSGGNTAPTYTTANITTTAGNPIKCNKGDVLTIQNLTIHTGTAAQGLTVYFNIERQRIGTFDDAVQTDTIGADSDVI